MRHQRPTKKSANHTEPAPILQVAGQGFTKIMFRLGQIYEFSNKSCQKDFIYGAFNAINKTALGESILHCSPRQVHILTVKQPKRQRKNGK